MDGKSKQSQSPKALAWKRFRSNTLGMTSCGFVLLWALLALFAFHDVSFDSAVKNTQIPYAFESKKKKSKNLPKKRRYIGKMLYFCSRFPLNGTDGGFSSAG